MELKLASRNDLPALYEFFAKAVENLRKNGIFIWDDVYPACALPGDIEANGLYMLFDGETLVAAFALCDINECEGFVDWIDNSAPALFIYRLAVLPSRLGEGIGSEAMRLAVIEAGLRGAKYLRLLVGDNNESAIRLYRKNGWSEAKGVFTKHVSDEITLSELGFEISTEAKG